MAERPQDDVFLYSYVKEQEGGKNEQVPVTVCAGYSCDLCREWVQAGAISAFQPGIAYGGRIRDAAVCSSGDAAVCSSGDAVVCPGGDGHDCSNRGRRSSDGF